MNIEPWTFKTWVATPFRVRYDAMGHGGEESEDENRKDFFSE